MVDWPQQVVHGFVHCVDGEAGVDVFHGGASALHGIEGLLVDIRALDGVDLLLQRHDLRLCLLERVLKHLLPPKRCLCRCLVVSHVHSICMSPTFGSTYQSC